MGNQGTITILAAVIAAVVAYLVANFRVQQDKKARSAEWLRDRIAHLNSVSRALNRFESRLTSKRSDVMAYEEKQITLEDIGGLQLRYPEVLFSSDTDKSIFQDKIETELSDKINELEEQIDELEEIVADFLKDGPNPEATDLSSHIKSMIDCSIEIRSYVEAVKGRLKAKLRIVS